MSTVQTAVLYIAISTACFTFAALVLRAAFHDELDRQRVRRTMEKLRTKQNTLRDKTYRALAENPVRETGAYGWTLRMPNMRR